MAKREMMSPPNNSFKHKEKKAPEPPKEIPEFVPGSVMESKVPIAKKLAGILFSEDIKTVKSYIFSDVVVPTLKDLLFKAITQGADVTIYGRGGSKPSAGTSKYGNASYTPYWQGPNKKPTTSYERRSVDVTEISFNSRRLAMDVLEEMKAVVEQYGNISVLGFHSIVEQKTGFLPSSSWTDNDFGWTDLSGVGTRMISGGRYILTLPEAVPLD